MNINELQADYAWQEAFAYANRPDSLDGTDCKEFTINDVARISASSEGYNDGDEWIILGKLKDGRWFYLAAGCDFTGWDCQAGGCAYVGASKKSMYIHIEASEMKRLGIVE